MTNNIKFEHIKVGGNIQGKPVYDMTFRQSKVDV